MKKILHWIYLALVLKYIVLVLRSFLPFVLPEVWRQYDTMGVSLRYWSRWSLEQFPEGTGFLQKYILPAILNSGEHLGIQPMEFPLINFFTAPFFVFGHEMGRALAAVFLYLVTFVLTILNANIWKGKKIFGLQTYPAFLLMPLFSVGLTWSCKFMPDYLSLLLVCMGVGLIWHPPHPPHPPHSLKKCGLAFILCSLGLLLKPTSVTVFFLFLGNSSYWRRGRIVWKTRKINELSPTLTAVSVSLLSSSLSYLYFTKGRQWVAQFQDAPNTFYLDIRPLAESWAELIKHYMYFFELWGQVFFFLGGFPLILGVLIYKTRKIKFHRIHWIWLVILLQFFLIGSLTGFQSYSHMYYFIGVTPLCCVLYMAAWKHANALWIRLLLAVGFVIPLFERFGMDLKNYVQPWRKDTIYEECRSLISRNPHFPWGQGYAFHSPRERFPQLGVCFGERQGSHSTKFGFSYANHIPQECRSIDQTKQLVLLDCSPKKNTKSRKH